VVNPAACSDGAGRLIVAGGKRAGQPLREVVAWTESAGWHALPQLRVSRDGPRAVSLMDGRAMVIGGSRGPADLASCEYLDPERGVWVGAPSMLTARRSFGCAVMPDGRVRPMHLPARLPHAATRRDAMRCDARQRCLPLHPVSVSLLGRWRGASTTRSLVSAHNLSRGVPHGFWLLGGECGRSSSRAASEVVARPPPAHRLPGRRGSSASLAGTGPILPPPQTHTLPLFLHLMPSPKSASSRRYY
jgi:hypothetical protein